MERLLAANRRAVVALLSEAAAIPGVEVEDKRWSVAIHFRNASPQSFRRRTSLLARLGDRPGIRTYRGHEVLEVQLVKGGGKSAGLRRLCTLAGWDPCRVGIVYAGEDENDAIAMRWVLRKGGTAICVGDRVHVPGAHHVDGPDDLARAVHRLAESTPGRREDRGEEGGGMTPFEAKDCALLVRMSGLSPATNLREMRDRISGCSGSVLFHHYCEATLRATFDNPDYRNDFAST